MTDLEKAIQKARCYDKEYSEDSRFGEVLKDPLRFVQEYPKILYLLLKEKHYRDGYLDGLAEGRKEKETIIGAMETIKNYCMEITKENGSCRKCIFCTNGYNGCKLQTSPNYWGVAE